MTEPAICSLFVKRKGQALHSLHQEKDSKGREEKTRGKRERRETKKEGGRGITEGKRKKIVCVGIFLIFKYVSTKNIKGVFEKFHGMAVSGGGRFISVLYFHPRLQFDVVIIHIVHTLLIIHSPFLNSNLFRQSFLFFMKRIIQLNEEGDDLARKGAFSCS